MDKSEKFLDAAFDGNLPLVQKLSLDPKIDPNWQDANGFTALSSACQKGSLEIVKFLLGLPGLEVNLANQNGATPFFIACQNAHLEVISLLLADQRAAVNQAMSDGFSPFLIACQNGHVEVVSLLLKDQRTNVNQATDDGTTPLWFAAQNGHLSVVEFILACGREIETKKRSAFNQMTAGEQARSQGARKRKDENEPEERFQRKRTNCPLIAEMISSFERAPQAVATPLRAKFGITEPWVEEYLGLPISYGTLAPSSKPVELREAKGVYLSKRSLAVIPSKIGDFTNLTRVDLSNNPITDSSAAVISTLLNHNKSLKSLNLTSTKIGPKGMLMILQALVRNFSQGIANLESFEVENLTLESFEGLEIIPIDILRLGSSRIGRYLLDLFQSPDADPLFRSKLMVVGFAEIGKTSMLECLFPLSGVLLTREVRKNWIFKDDIFWNDCFVKLVGNNLSQSEVIRFNHQAGGDKGNAGGEKRKYFGTVHLNKKAGWAVGRIDSYEQPGFEIRGPNGFLSELYCTNKGEREKWFTRIDELLKRDRTHGIDVREIDISSHRVVKSHFEKHQLKGKVELSVWDFAGQHDYYNNHQHFLSARSVFLVLWNVSDFREEGISSAAASDQKRAGKPTPGKGIEGLDFWLSSLSFHLNQLQQKKDGGYNARDYFNILVVGTHFDRLDHRGQTQMGLRRSAVQRLCDKYDLPLGPAGYLEVSCVDNLVNISELQETVFGETLSMKYMGERIPLSYLSVESYVGHLLERNRDYPVVNINAFYGHFKERIVRDALSLLHQWGRCVYFENDERLKDQVVLNSQFLSKTALAGFFRLDQVAQEKRRDGVIRHADLKTFWAEPSLSTIASSTSPPSPPLVDREDFWQIAEMLMSFMEKFDVCFVLPEDQGKPFIDQQSLLPSLLPPRQNDRLIKNEISLLQEAMTTPRSKIKTLSPEYEMTKRLFDRKELTEAGISNFLILEKSYIAEERKLQKLEIRIMELGNDLKAAQPWKRFWGEELGIDHKVQFERVFQFGSIPAELISRMLARLHGMIEGGCVKRDCALLRNAEGTQAKVTVDVLLDQFAIEIRAGSLELGEKMLKDIKGSISQVLDRYPQLTAPSYSGSDGKKKREEKKREEKALVQIVEGVRSPFSDRIIPLEVIKSASGRDLSLGDEPTTSVIKLKEMAGLIAPTPLVRKPVARGSAEWTEFAKIFKFLGGSLDIVTQVYDIEDPEYRSMFEANRKLYFQQHRNAPKIFCKQDHKEGANAGLRGEYLGLLERKQQQYKSTCETKGSEDESQRTPVLAMIHGTKEAIGWNIAQGGFGIVASVDDGYYGQGIYFTSKVNYSIGYTLEYEKPVLIISMVNPGNVFPVVEHPNRPGNFLGQKCKLGYQAHYCVTGSGFYPTEEKVREDSNDELVLFERAQALPRFLIYFK